MTEKGQEVALQVEKPWERREDLLFLNPAGEVPVLVDDDQSVIVGDAILEYLEETVPTPALIPGPPADRAEVRRLVDWFAHRFDQEVTVNLVGEKLIKRLSGQGYPAAVNIRAGLANIHYHLDYIGYLAERRRWLAGEHFSLADVVAATQLSAVDYIDSVPWADHPEAKDWYARIKSRPSFRPLLADQLPGIAPPPHYADLDF